MEIWEKQKKMEGKSYGLRKQKHSLEHWEEDPSLNTTRNVLSQIDFIDMVLHIGDISYAVGYSAQVLVFIYLD